MQNPPGVFVVLEGADGSGKSTQFNLLKARLEAVGYDVDVFKFPQYDNPSSIFVRKYLNGDYGKATEVSPYTASLFYAMDRFEGAPAIRKSLAAGHIALCDRYVGANMAHQGSKFAAEAEQRGFFVWEDSLEYELLGIPRPNVTFFLEVPAEVSQKLLSERAQKTGAKLDEHEKDVEHLKKTVSTYQTLCQLFPNDFKSVTCVEDDKLLGIPEINNRIWEELKPMLPAKPSKPGHNVVVKLNETKAAETKSPKTSDNPKLAEKPQFTEKLSLFAYYEALQAGLDLGAASKAWHKNNYEYFKPGDLAKKTLAKYDELLTDMTTAYKAVKAKLGKDPNAEKYLLAMTPLAALTQAKASVNTVGLQDVIKKLTLSESKEIVGLAEKLNALGRQVDSRNFKAELATSAGKGPEPINKILARLAADHLPQNLPQEIESVVLVEASPRNEFKVLADTIYQYSRLPRTEIETEIDNWSYQQKTDALESAVRTGTDDILAKFQYQFDVTADNLTLEEVLKSGLAANIKVQPATPRFGYDVPDELDKYGATDEFLEAFDKSLELFSTLQAAGREDLASYATLVGHKTRFHLTCTLENINASLQADNSPEVRRLLNAILEQIGERHPVAIAGLVKAQVPAPKADKKPESKMEIPKSPAKKSRSRRRGGKPKKS